MQMIKSVKIEPVSMIRRDGLQRIELHSVCERPVHTVMSLWRGETKLAEADTALDGGEANNTVFLPPPDSDIECEARFYSKTGELLYKTVLTWKKPREWTIYIAVSSHTDIGLHNSQYIQRYNSVRFADMAMKLCDDTADRAPENQYHYMMEGSWFFSNYPADKGRDAAQRLVDEYIRPGKISVGAGVAGNHTQSYGLEEVCRSAYSRRWLYDNWQIDTKTMTMIDNNGLSWGIVKPYHEAGYDNILFAPNQWNPLPSTTWKYDRITTGESYTWNPDMSGGGSRVDVRYDSWLPLVFNWEAPDRSGSLLVWCSTQYGHAGILFGFPPDRGVPLKTIEDRMSGQLRRLEEKYPYDIWMFASYNDDQTPGMGLTDSVNAWNGAWKYPIVQTVGRLDEPFDKLRAKYGDRIPTLRGEITGGWYQHPLSAPDVLSVKYEADRLLPTAEKLASLAALLDTGYTYPALSFERAWAALIMNDEHSYGTSGYQGRRVYETWMQHRDWTESALATARLEARAALEAIASKVYAETDSLLVFNPTARERSETVEFEGREYFAENIPALGYTTLPLSSGKAVPAEDTFEETGNGAPRAVENDYYRLTIKPNGSLSSIFDKQLGRELLDTACGWGANEFVYTKDNHQSFTTPTEAEFKVIRSDNSIRVVSKTNDTASGARIVSTVTLPLRDKRIDFDNRLYHVCDMFNTHRYYRYAYFTFPFEVERCRRICHLNGCEAEYAVDVTGHGTDTYMAVNEWCCAENDKFGVGFIQLDSSLVEFDHIHPDKTDFSDPGDSSKLFSYVANDWLQMHLTGGSSNDLRFRYTITSYSGNHASAHLAELSERIANPPLTVRVGAKTADSDNRNVYLPERRGFLTAKSRLLTMKPARDGDGIILRLYGDSSEFTQDSDCFGTLSVCRNTVDEQEYKGGDSIPGFTTFRLRGVNINLRDEPQAGESLSIGQTYTGLIQKPRAFRGENDGQLYLLWGHASDPDLDHYELYRSEVSGFVPDESTLIAKVEPGVYCVGRYEDTGLEKFRAYYYRVRAVSKSGVKGEFSDEFRGVTKEDIQN